MSLKSRLILSAAACLLLSNCGLINSALRLAPYALMFADETGGNEATELRGRQVEGRRVHGILPMNGNAGSEVAFKH
ncbi:MAG TPA: hypothetical protein PLB55_09095 [Prosthecobacter sp.]|jgi:hypothetical protein|nr:hypothetical protein [Prosthecobacter sp.]